MKPLRHLSSISPFIFFPVLLLIRKKTTGKFILLILGLFMLAGCFQFYYKTNTRHTIDAATIQQLQGENKYFILHYRDTAVSLYNIVLSNERIDAKIVALSPNHSEYLNPDKNMIRSRDTTYFPRKPHYRVKATQRFDAFMEVHLYIDENMQEGQAQFSSPLSSFKRIDIYELDAKTTTTNHVLSIVGIVAAPFAILFIAYAITCNCPQVCVNNNGNYQFVSGVYSGSVYSSLERTDYLPLHDLQTINNSFDIKIKNVPDEEQFINRMQLLQVNHPADVNVLADRHGTILSYSQPQAPVKAIINKKTDITSKLSSADDDQYLFDGEKGEKGFSNVVLTFNKPTEAQKAKLIIHGGNSLWSGYLYHSFAELFGTGYEKWRNEKDKADPKEMEQWQMEQELPLMVYVEKNSKWEFADYFAHTGNTASRDMIMELDISSIKTDQVKIKLETVYQFWDLDYTGIDFSENKKLNTAFIDLTKAAKKDGSGQVEKLNAVDQDYCDLKSNEELNLEYTPATLKEGVNSYFFVSTGYYHNLKKYEGTPQVSSLMKFKRAGAFDEFSRQKFEEVQNTLAKVSLK
ncbi:MAG: hypothetical protein ACHQF0_12160 [Chitinophagales bacterium]